MIYSYRDLEVWKKGRKLVSHVYALTEKFPKQEQYSLTQQMQRAAISIPSNIAEGHSRSGTKDYRHFISIAIGSLSELDTQLYLAQDPHYTDELFAENLRKEIVTLQKMLHGLRNALDKKLSA